MRTIEVKLYTFEELSEKAKQVAIEKWREDDDMPFLSDDMHEYLGEVLREYKMKFEDTHLFYSLSYSQGDGAMFTGSISWKGYTFKIEHYGNYYHENSKQITEITRNNGNEISDATWSKMFNLFEPTYTEICRKVRDYGYSLIESIQSGEAISETLIANEYEYTEDGRAA